MDLDGQGLRIVDAEAVTLRLAAATSFKGRDPEAACAEALRPRRPYADLSRGTWRTTARCSGASAWISGRTGTPSPRTSAWRRVRAGAVDPGLAALYFQYGRYLLIASSRPGTQPANLQGLWNDDLRPAWGSKYTININTEMNYWPAEVTNLAECHEPLFDLIEELREAGRRTAQAHYGARGLVAHHNTDLWRVATPVDGARWGLWPLGGAWLSTHLFEHYAFGGDLAFLRRAYPTLKEASEFVLDFLVEDEAGRLVTNPSHSPENAFLDEKGNEGVLCVGATMDFGIIRELFGATASAARKLGEDAELAAGSRARSPACPPIRSASTASSRSGSGTSTRPSPATATSRTSSPCTPAARSPGAARRSWPGPRACPSSAAWRTAAAARAGAAPGSSTSSRGSATATRPTRT